MKDGGASAKPASDAGKQFLGEGINRW